MTKPIYSESSSIDSNLRDAIMSQMRSNKFSGVLKLRPPRRTEAIAFVKRPRDTPTASNSYSRTILPTVCSLFSEHFNGGEVESVVYQLQGLEIRHAELTCADVSTEAEHQPTLGLLLSFDALAGLCTLDLECNSLGNDGVAQLCAQCLPRLSHLSSLFLASNGIGITGLEAIVEYTEKSHSLQAIGLTNNPLYLNDENGVDDTTVLLVRLFCANRMLLRRVHLNHVGMPTHAALELMRVVGGSAPFHKLEALYLKHNKVDMEQLQVTLDEISGKSILSLLKF